MSRGGRRRILFILAGLLLLPGLTGCAVPSMVVARLPRGMRPVHVWGPQSNQARLCGERPPIPTNPESERWAEFGQRILKDGDIVFCKGRPDTVDGSYISKVVADIGDSPFSHIGIAVHQHNRVWIYDVKAEGVRKVPYEFWMHDVDEASLAVRRLKSCYYDRIPLVLDFCEQSYLMEIPYDYFFDDNDDEFYCAELIEKAFQAAGLRLSEPVPVRYLPNYPQYRKLVFFLACLSPISSDNPVYAPGNTHYGTLSSPFLEAVYQTPEVTAFLQTCKPPLDWQGPGRAELRKQPGDDSR